MSDLQNIIRTIRFFTREQLKHPGLFGGMVVSHMLAQLVYTYLPALLIADMLRRLSEQDFAKGDLWGSFGWQIAGIIGLEIIGAMILWRLVILFIWKLEAVIIRDMQQTIFEHLMRMSANFHANTFGGSLVSQSGKLQGAYIRYTDTTLFHLLGLVWALVFSSIILIGKAPLFVVGIVVLTAVYVAVAFFMTGKIRRLNANEAEASNKTTGALADAVTNVMAIKGFAGSHSENKHFAGIAERQRQATHQLMGATVRRDILFSGIGVGMTAVSITLAAASVVLFGTDIAVTFLVLNYTTQISQRLWEFSVNGLRNYNRSFGDAAAMMDILSTDPEVADPTQPEKPRITRGAIVFDNVDFTHGENSDALFSQLNLHIKPGEKIGLVGHSGSGKTTLTRLLLRFSDIDGGAITVDEQNIAHLNQDDLRRHIAYVPQEPLLFHRSIFENIAYGKPGASKAQVIEAAKKANAHEFIDTLSDKYDTLVGERGVKLSGGQRQRIAIARAILKDAPILVLDEATSALDSESEALIQDALRELMKHRTAIAIAHRLSTIQRMDRIIVLDKGRIIEQGSHAQLIAAKGVYASLWAHQSGGFIEE